MKFYKCKKCGNIAAYVEKVGSAINCCGKEMPLLKAHENDDNANEKHLPVITVNGNDVNVNVGSINHPMGEEHSIKWIALETKQGNQRKELSPTGEPTANFKLVDGDEVKCAYAYCNLHGLWKKEF